MSPTFIPFSTLCVLAIVVHHASSDIEVRNKSDNLIRSFDSDVTLGNPFGEPMTGLVVLADPPDACTPIKKVDFCCNVTQFSKFVLIAGSTSLNCTIERKIENAVNADFDLAILYGEKIYSMAFSSIYWDTSELTALKISHSDGQMINSHYLFRNNSDNYFYLTVFFKNRYHYYMMLFVATIALCFVVIIFFVVCLCVKYIQERRRSRRNRLSSRQIKRLPTEKYRTGSQYETCAICLDGYNEGEKLRILPCQHAYHARCVDPWLMDNRRNCPLCKRKVHFGDSSSDDDSSSESEFTATTESTPLVGPPSSTNTWGTFSGQSTSGIQSSSCRQGVLQPRVVNLTSGDDTDSSESDNIMILPSTTGSVNAAYDSDVNAMRPNSV